MLAFPSYYRPSGHILHARWKVILGSDTPDQVIEVPTIAAASWNFGRQIDRDSDTQNKMLKTHLLVYCMTTNNVYTVNTHILERSPKILDHGNQY